MKSKYTKRDEAAERQAFYATLTVEQKIAQCKNRRGASRKELHRLINPKPQNVQ